MGKLSKHTRKRLIKLLTAMGMFGLMAVWDWAIRKYSMEIGGQYAVRRHRSFYQYPAFE